MAGHRAAAGGFGWEGHVAWTICPDQTPTAATQRLQAGDVMVLEKQSELGLKLHVFRCVASLGGSLRSAAQAQPAPAQSLSGLKLLFAGSPTTPTTRQRASPPMLHPGLPPRRPSRRGGRPRRSLRQVRDVAQAILRACTPSTRCDRAGHGHCMTADETADFRHVQAHTSVCRVCARPACCARSERREEQA